MAYAMYFIDSVFIFIAFLISVYTLCFGTDDNDDDDDNDDEGNGNSVSNGSPLGKKKSPLADADMFTKTNKV